MLGLDFVLHSLKYVYTSLTLKMKKFITLENGNQVLKEANSRQNYIAESGLTLILDFAVSESYKIVLNENCNLSFLNFEGGAAAGELPRPIALHLSGEEAPPGGRERLALDVVIGRPERLPPSVLQRLFESLAGSCFLFAIFNSSG